LPLLETIKFKEITNYFIDEVIHTEEELTNIEQKYVYQEISRKFPSLYNSKELEDFTPQVFGSNNLTLRRFKIDNKYIDKQFEGVQIII